MGLGLKLDFKTRRAGISAAYNKGYTRNVTPGVSGNAVGRMNQPMLAELRYLFTLGDLTVGANGCANAAEMSALEYYNYIRSANVSLAAYKPVDVFKITVAILELYSLHDELVRDFKLMYKIDFENVAFNTLTTAAFGLNAIQNDAANIANRLNRAAKDLRKFPVLKGIAAFDDLLYISNNLFADDQINKAGTIAFTKLMMLDYDVTAGSSTVGSLKYTSLSTMSYINKLVFLETKIREYAADDDVNAVCSEILKAEKVLYTYPLAILDEDNLSECAKDLHRVFDWEIYDRILNATMYPIATNFATTTIAGIQEDANGILLYGIDTVTNRGQGSMVAANYDNSSVNSNQAFRPTELSSWVFCHCEDPSEEAVVQFLAHHEHIESVSDASARYFVGLSIIHISAGRLWLIDGNSGNNVVNYTFTTLPYTSSTFVMNLNNFTDKTQGVINLLEKLQEYNSFGCLPVVWPLIFDSSTSYQARMLPAVRDICNFATISTTTLDNLKAMYTRGALCLNSDNADIKRSGRFGSKGSKGKRNKGKDKGSPKSEDLPKA